MQPDWPRQTRTVGFPLYDERDLEHASADLEQFLAQGSPPIVFTPGSAMMHAREFFETSATACYAIGRRGILLTRHADQVPTNLPEGVRHFDYIPFSQILPKAACLVHHGGIGTSAQAMHAGVPQVVMPFGHDQFDNAARMQRLGVARTIKPKAYRASRVARVLSELLGDSRVAESARAVAARFQPEDWMHEICECVESLADERVQRKGDHASVVPVGISSR
jgi:UDP:flavonoid glycosyltransferase YjiC (YdhE family)